MQREKIPDDAMSEVPVQRQHVGLGGFAASGEDTEMPDITSEKFPAELAVIGMIVFQHSNCTVTFLSFVSRAFICQVVLKRSVVLLCSFFV